MKDMLVSILRFVFGLLPSSLVLRTLYVYWTVDLENGISKEDLYDRVQFAEEPNWYLGIVSLQQIKAGHDGESGAHYKQYIQFNGLPLINIIEVIDAKPGDYKRFIGRGLMWYSSEYRVETTEKGARLINTSTLNGYFLSNGYIHYYIEESVKAFIKWAGDGKGHYNISVIKRLN